VKWLKIWNVPTMVSVNGPKREVKFVMLHHSNASVHSTHSMLSIRSNLLWTLSIWITWTAGLPYILGWRAVYVCIHTRVSVNIWQEDVFSITAWAKSLGLQSENMALLTVIPHSCGPKNDMTWHTCWHTGSWVSLLASQLWKTHNASHITPSLLLVL
jgi:hypothetical protein